jgi:hypothetical protein
VVINLWDSSFREAYRSFSKDGGRKLWFILRSYRLICFISLNGRMNLKRFGRNRLFPCDTEGAEWTRRKNWVRIGFPTEIRTEYLSNSSYEHCPYTNIFHQLRVWFGLLYAFRSLRVASSLASCTTVRLGQIRLIGCYLIYFLPQTDCVLNVSLPNIAFAFFSSLDLWM